MAGMSASGGDGGYSLLVQDIQKAWAAAIALKEGRRPEGAPDKTPPTPDDDQSSLF